MNIEKLARHLKEFTLDEIEMIAECDCRTDLEHLLNEGKIVFEQGLYKYVENSPKIDFGVFISSNNNQNLAFEDAVNTFIENYAKKHCRKRTYETYESIFRVNITPFFRNYFLNDITQELVIEFYKKCKSRQLGIRRLKNTMTLLNQLIKYFQNLGVIDKSCNFQVRRLTDKNKFSINRIIFED
ncbi:MAG: N-terminal phage integrase SAM-like domain-containing protein [Fusobacterium sp.]|nr:N-terminal phage integrase SAM-like domain-containing protein [Fusobacterium sp.]